MKKFSIFHRRILLGLSILLFFVIAILTLTYAFGFRYDFDSNKVKKVGFLTIKGFPETAQVFVNGQEKATKLPSQIRNLLPGEYLVEIKKNDYQTWLKKLPIVESMVTVVESVQLVLTKSKTESLIESDINKDPVLSNDKRLVAWADKENNIPIIKLYDFNNLTAKKIDLNSLKLPISILESTDAEIVSWDQRNIWLLLKITDQNTRYYLALNSQNPLESYLVQNSEGKFIWDFDTDGQLFRFSQKKLSRQNKTLVSPILNQSDFYDVAYFAGTNYGLTLTGEKLQTSVLWKWDNNNIQSLIIFTGSGKLEFCSYNSDQLCLYNPASKKSLLLINNLLIPLGENINQVSIASSGDKILLLAVNELYLLTLNTVDNNNPVWKKKILTRYSNQILKAYWHSEFEQIIFLLPNEIKMIDIDFRDQPNQFSIKNNLDLTLADQIIFSDNKKDPFFYFLESKSNKLYLSKIIWQ